MKKTVGVFSLIVMVLTQIITPYAYAVGDVSLVDEVVTDVVAVEEPMVLEPIEDEKEGTEEIPTIIEQGDSSVADELEEGTNGKEVETQTGDTTVISEEQTEEISSGDNDVLSGEQENLEEEEIENLSGAESSSGFFESITEGVKNLLGIGGTSENEEIIESKEIYGTGEYEGVKVEVYAQTGLFESGTVLTIEPVIEEKLEQVKEVLSGEVGMVEEEEEQTVIAFDITFRDPVTQEELQPKNGTVQVMFNYEDNESLVQAEENEEQEVKVYHLNDIDEEGNKIEELSGTTVEEVVVNEEESEEENVLVVKAETFSVYTIVVQIKEEQLTNFSYGMISIANPSNSSQGITIMDRNLGAQEAGTGNSAYGYYYQWGNNYGFDRSKGDSSVSKNGTKVNVSSLSEYSGSTFVTDNYSWMTTNKSLWSEIGQGPCPEGWHIPSNSDWTNIYSYYINTYNNSGAEGFLDYFKIPQAGSHRYYNYYESYSNYLWSSSRYNGNAGYGFSTNVYEHKISNNLGKADGLPIRCFRDNYTPIDNYYTLKIDFNLGAGSIAEISIKSGDFAKIPSNPTNTDKEFIGWFMSGTEDEFNFTGTRITGDIELYAMRACDEGYNRYERFCFNNTDNIYTLTYDANGGYFDNLVQQKQWKYEKNIKQVKTSHTPNFSEGGTQLGGYPDSYRNTEVIEIPGADKLHITIDYGSYDDYRDYVSIWPGNHPEYKAKNDYGSSISGKLGGSNNRKEYDIEGNSVTFSFESEWFSDGDDYGYYALIEGYSFDPQDTNEIFENPTKDGSQFLGRYEEGVPEYYDFSKKIFSNKTLYARWSTGESTDHLETTLVNGKEFNKIIKSLAKGESVTSENISDSLITEIKRAEWLPNGANTQIISEGEIPVYGRYKDGFLYYYSDADVIYLNSDSSHMFKYLESLVSIDFNGINTTKVENMGYMFNGCSKLINLDLSSFDTSNVTNMEYMFSSCSSLTSLDLSNFDTSKVTNMESMFSGCSKLTSLDLNSYDTSNVTNMRGMFSSCSKLTSLDLNSFDTSNVTSMGYMFQSCSSLTSLDVSNFVTSKVTDMGSMFYGCSSLTSLNLSNFDMSNVTSISSMFYNCRSILNINTDNWDTSNVEYMSSVFQGCVSLKTIDLSHWNVENVRDMGYLFDGCSDLISINLSNWNAGNAKYMGGMFENCSSLTSLDLSGFDTSSATEIRYMFENCSSLTSLDLSSFDTRSVTSMESMFYGCSSLTSLDLSSFDTSSVTNMGGMFSNCSSLTSLDLSGFDTSNVTTMSSMFYNCSSLTNLDLSNFDTSSVTEMGSMFGYCSSLTGLDLSSFNTSNLKNVQYMFQGCSNLEKIFVGKKFRTNSITNDYYMFYNNEKLRGGNGTEYNSSHYNKVYAKIDNEYQSGYFTQSGTNIATAYLLPGQAFNKAIKSLVIDGTITSVTNYSDDDTSITGFQREKNLPNGVNTKISDSDSEEPIYARYENGLIHYRTNANTIEMNGNSSYMFANLKNLEAIDLNIFDTNLVTNMTYIFDGCSSLTSLNLSGINVSRVQNMQYMFNGCSNLEELDLSNWKPSNARGSNGSWGNFDMQYMFNGCEKLNSLKLDGRDLSNTTKSLPYNAKWLGDTSLKKISAKGWKLPRDFYYRFNRILATSSLEEIDVSYWDISKTEQLHGLFEGTPFKRIIGVNTWSGINPRLYSISSMFRNCMNLTELDMSNFEIGRSTNISSMFEGCSSLTGLNLSKFDTSKVTSMSSMFKGADKLEIIYVSDKFTTENVASSANMFLGLERIIGGNGTTYDENNIDVGYAKIDSDNTKGYFTNTNQFAVKFLTTSGDIVDTQRISSGGKATELINTQRVYFYYTDQTLQNEFDFNLPLTKYTEIYVTWDEICNVYYEYGSGVKPLTIISGSCIIENAENRAIKGINCEVNLPNLELKTGYNTPLWYKKGEDISYPSFKITLTGDETLEAKGIPNNYTVVYKPGDGTGVMASQEFTYDKEEMLNQNEFHKNGYNFRGWIDDIGNIYRNGETILNLLPEGIIEFTAQWSMIQPSAGGGKIIQQQVKEQEHNVAEEKTEENKVEQEEKIQETNTPEKTDTKTIQETTMTNTNTSSQSTPVTKEVQSAYEWAYGENVTTMPTLEEAMPEGVVKRGHLAKMVVNYATNVLGYTIPEKIPSECRWNDWRSDWESEEIKEYAVKSCALGLMGLDMDKFLPNMEVTRAQFGTIMSRLLWGKKYAGGTPYYRKHLNALKENGIMNQIENPERRTELRQWVWLMLMRSAEN